MDPLHGIHESVKFDYESAARLAAELRNTAETLDGQVPRRHTIKNSALEEWRGVFARQFPVRIQTCTNDARRLADAMRQAADGLDELALLAREEESRRERARQWEAEQKSEGNVEKFLETITNSDEQPFSEPPRTPKDVVIPSAAPAGRE
jgi:uncharacterized protein YukE